MSTSKKFAFRDSRTPIKLLASARLPKSVTIIKKNPLPSKLRGLFRGRVGGAIGRFALQAGLKATLGPVGGKALNLLNGRVGGILGRVGGLAGQVARAVTLSAYGARIIEELDPRKLVRPQREGVSANPAQMARPLAETAAASVAASLISGVPLANPLSGLPRVFKTPASLVKSPRFFNPKQTTYTLPANTVASAQTAVQHLEVSSNTAVLYPQRGLLEDEIFYRLVLIAENVYAPVNEYVTTRGLGPLVILEGFRAENSGNSPHERGEAIDMTVGDGSLQNASKLFAIAQWMRGAVLYDQLILCYSPVRGGQCWIHVTLTPDARRRQVFTKPFNDVHVPGLHLYGPYTDATVRAQDASAMAKDGGLAQTITTIMSGRDVRLNPVEVGTLSVIQAGTNPLLTLPSGGGVGAGGTGSGGTGSGGVVGDCGGCEVVYPRAGLPTTGQLFDVARGVKAELEALGMSFATEAEMQDWYTNGREGSDTRKYQLYQQQLMKAQMVCVITARRLQKMGFTTVGLFEYAGASGNAYRSSGGRAPDQLSYNDNSVNAFYDQYASRIVDGTPELPAGVLTAGDTILASKNGPEIDFMISGTTVGLGHYNGSACEIPTFTAIWRHPLDGSNATYPAAGTPGTELVLTGGCVPATSSNSASSGATPDAGSGGLVEESEDGSVSV